MQVMQQKGRATCIALNSLEYRFQTFSAITAVPYASTSLMFWPISLESNRIMTIALAPIAEAFTTRRSMACFRASSSIAVYSWISPPIKLLSPANIVPPSPLLRTTRPKTWPFTVSGQLKPASNGHFLEPKTSHL